MTITGGPLARGQMGEALPHCVKRAGADIAEDDPQCAQCETGLHQTARWLVVILHRPASWACRAALQAVFLGITLPDTRVVC